MNEKGPQENSSVATTFTQHFVDTLEMLIGDNRVIIEDYGSFWNHTKVRSAKAVHKKTIGKLSMDHQTFYLFPDLLVEQLIKNNPCDYFLPIFGKKKKLRKMLIKGGLITRRIDGHIENHVHYNGVLVEAWPIDFVEYEKRYFNNKGE